MKKAAVFLSLAVIVVLSFGSRCLAFHDGGDRNCETCHAMHSQKGLPRVIYKPGAQLGKYLILSQDPSSSCLKCHQEPGKQLGPSGYYVSTDTTDLNSYGYPIELTPGGDFAWLKKSFSWMSGGVMFTSEGYLHGHNIVALEYGYMQDPLNAVAPGGSYPSAALTCISCHDPHGKYRRNQDGSITSSGSPIIASGSYNTSPSPGPGEAVGVYRLLAGVGYQPSYLKGNYAFVHPPPAAVAPSHYNQVEYDLKHQVRVAYGSGMSNWCRNCHPGMHINTGNSPVDVVNSLRAVESFPQTGQTPYGSHTHNVGDAPDDELGNTIAANYNDYIASGDWAGQQSSSYLSLVPFEENTMDYAVLKAHANSDGSYLAGPGPDDKVSCLTCHRAHASGWDFGMRFKYDGISDGNYGLSETMTDSCGGVSCWPDPASDPENAMGRTPGQTQQAYYGRPAALFAPNQKVLCNKCHIGDPTGVSKQPGY